jgi:hypothetical protein
MTKGEAISLYNALGKLGYLSGVKFAYAVSKNLSLLKPELEALQKAVEPSEEYKVYDKKRVELAEKYAKKDENEKAVIINNEYKIENQKEFNKEFEKLKKEFPKEIEIRDNQIKEQNELLKTEYTGELYKVSLFDIPKEITVAQMDSIMAIVSEDLVSPYKE